MREATYDRAFIAKGDGPIADLTRGFEAPAQHAMREPLVLTRHQLRALREIAVRAGEVRSVQELDALLAQSAKAETLADLVARIAAPPVIGRGTITMQPGNRRARRKAAALARRAR